MELDSFKDRLLNLRAASFLLMILSILYCLSTTTADPDLWGYLAFGRLFWGRGPFPYLDVFAYVPTLRPWIYHEWLTGVVFYPIYRILGAPGLQVLKYALGLATVGTIYLTARRRGADLWPTALILFFVLVCMSVGYSAVRAQVFTYFFFALFLYLLETARLTGNWRCLWLLAPIQLGWCNLHGGFLAGLGLVFLYAVGEALSRRPFWPYLGCFLLAGLVTLINPYGVKYWSYLVQAVTMPRPEITEWVSIFVGYKQGFLNGLEFYRFLALTAVAVFLAWWARWREITPALVLLLTLYLAVKHNRHQVFFALSFGAYMPVLLTAYFRELKTRPGFMAWMHRLGGKIPALIIIFLIFFFTYRLVSRNPLKLEMPSEPILGTKNEMYYPVGAIDYLEQHHLSGKLLVSFNWGEYCLWKLYPQCRVAIDGRYETVYPDRVNKEYFEFLQAREGWRNFLAHYPPDLILIELRSRPYALLSRDPQWRQVYADPGCVLFRRHRPVPPGPAQAHIHP
jgi:hypothetical protein